MVRSSCTGPKPGVMAPTICGAKMNIATPRTASPMSIRLMTVDTTRHARGISLAVNSAVTIGIRADDNAPAATSWKMRSGTRNAAKNVSSSADGATPEIATTRT